MESETINAASFRLASFWDVFLPILGLVGVQQGFARLLFLGVPGTGCPTRVARAPTGPVYAVLLCVCVTFLLYSLKGGEGLVRLYFASERRGAA